MLNPQSVFFVSFGSKMFQNSENFQSFYAASLRFYLSSIIVCFCLINLTASRSEEVLWEADRSAFSSTPVCETSSANTENAKWCYGESMRQWKSCSSIPSGSQVAGKLSSKQLSSQLIELPNSLDEFVLSLKFTIQSCDDIVLREKSLSCSEEFSTEVFGVNERYPVESEIPAGVRLFSKSEKTALGTALNENYPIENRSGYKYIIIKFTASYSCVILENIKLKAERCPSEVSNLVKYDNAYASQITKYEGTCVENSILNGKYLPLRKCSHGRWMTYYEASSCVCKAGFFLANAKCAECPRNYYKRTAGNQQCVRCPLYSTSLAGASNCSCNHGFYHNPKSPNDPSCYQMPQKPQVWRVINESNTVHMNVSTGVMTAGTLLEVECLNCGSLRPEIIYTTGSVTVNGLTERTRYVFKVSAVNQVSSLDPDRTSVEVVAQTRKSRRVQGVSCSKSFDRIVITWDPVEPDGEKSAAWLYLTSSGNTVYMPQYWVKVHEGDSNTVMDFFTNETSFSTSNLNPQAPYMYKVGLRNDPKSFSNEVFCSNKGPMLTNEQIQGITILTGSISIVFVFLISILFVVFCYYKKKRDEWHYKSYGTTGDVSKYNPDFKSFAASMQYSSPNQNASPSSYGATLTPNQYLLSDFNDNFNPNVECSPFHTAVNFAAEQERLKEMGAVPLLACSGVDLYLEASQFYETYETLLLDYSRELPATSLTLNPSTPHSPSLRGPKLNGSFGAGLYVESGSLLVDEKEGKIEKVKVTVMGENLVEEDLRIFAIQVITMASFRHPNVLFLHGVVTSSSPLMCVIEDPDIGTLDTLLAQIRSSWCNGSQVNYQASSDYMKIPFLTSSKDDPSQSPTSDGVHSSTKSSGSSNSGTENLGNTQNGIQIPEMLHLLRGVALGMQYLHDGGIYVHKVLCSSNIYVNRNRMCKIGGFDMRAALEVYTHNAIFSADVTKGQNPVLPVYLQEIHRILTPWTALEIFDRGPFTQASDVWSFGNIMWNIFSVGQKPFFEWNRNEIVRMLCSGYRLPPPDGCPDSMYELMMFCWSSKTIDRPTFAGIRQCLEKMICNPNFTISAMGAFNIGNDNRYFGSELDCVDSTDVFLDKLGMKNYFELFEKNGICKINELLSVKNSTLKNMGVRSSKDRRKILGAINSLRASSRPAYLKQHSLIQPPTSAPSKTKGTTLSRLV